MKQRNHLSEHSRANEHSWFSEQLKKLWAWVALGAVLAFGSPQEVEAQVPQQNNKPKTEQVQNKTDSVQTVEIQKAPDYIWQAPAKLKQYYPEEEAYFQKIFDVVNNAWPEITMVANLKLEELFNEFPEDFVDEKERWTAVLMFCELGYPATEFTKKQEKLDEFGIDIRQIAATEALEKMTIHFAREEKKAKEELAKAKEENAKAKEKLKKTKAKLKEFEELWKKIDKQREETIQGTERILEEIDLETVKSVPEVQKMVRYYEKICKENWRTPTKKAQELINQLPEKQKKN